MSRRSHAGPAGESRRKPLAAILRIGFLLLLTAALSPAAEPARVVKISVRPLPPVATVDQANHITGFAVDALEEAARRVRYRLVWAPSLDVGLDLTSTTRILQSGEADIVIRSSSEEAKRMFYVSDPWWSFDMIALTLGSSPIRTESDLKGRTIAVPHSAIGPVMERYGANRIVREEMRRDAIRQVCAGTVDAAIVADIQLRDYMFEPPRECWGTSLKMIDTPLRRDLVLVALPHAAGLARSLMAGLNEMAMDGRLAAIASRNPQLSSAHISRLMAASQLRLQRRIWWISIAAFAVVMALCVAWIVRQRQVNWRLERDLEARIRAEAALRDSEARFHALFDSAPQTVVAMDHEGRIAFVNHAVESMFGHTRDELAGKSVEALLPERLREPFREGRLQGRQDAMGLRADGKEFPVEIELSAVNTGEGLTLAFIADVSERRTLQQQLLQAQKLESVGRLTGGVAHDFNNLLTVIRGYAQLTMDDAHTPEGLREPLTEIARAADRAAALTRQLLMFSRREAGAPRIISLNETIRNLEKMMRRIIGEDVKLSLAVDEAAPDIKADPVHVEQVVMNLALNARDAMPGGGDLIIETGAMEVDEEYAASRVELRPGLYALLKVSDNGTGMPAEVQAHIFEPFFTTKEPGKGTGLGLSTVYGIVKQAGGAIFVYSESGRGTTFKILFPAAAHAPELEARREETPVALGGSETILLAEDEPGVRKFVTQVLRSQGYTVLEAANGKAALEVAEAYNGPIHVLLTDMVMPEMGGSDLAARFRELHPGCPVLLMSGYSDRLLQPGPMGALIEKPCPPTTLLRRLREALETPQC